MDEIFVTVRTQRHDAVDLKIPGFITGEEFLQILSVIIGTRLPPDTKMQAEPVGRILDNAQTLASDGVENGALITLLSGEVPS